jgi:RNA polymerase sigma factor (sigma-70 family)
MSETDLELLRRYAGDHAEEAFAELVRRHIGLVYSSALRQVRSPELAREVTQSAFIKLAQHAQRMAAGSVVTAWLYQVTRREAIDVVRREARRQLREQIATEMNAMDAIDADWTHIEPLLDEAMHALDDSDRTAVLLRYFENRSLREVGKALGTSDDAAQKRVSRAVARLREFLVKRGVTVGASGLVIVVSANAVGAAPAGMAATISTAATLAAKTISGAATTTATKIIAMTTLQKSLVTATVAVLAGVGIYQARLANNFRQQARSLQVEQVSLAGKIADMTRTSDDARQQVASLLDENDRLKRNTTELPRLRSELAQLKNDSQELAKLKLALAGDQTLMGATSWKDRVNRLKQRLEETPEAKIPELQFLTETDWLSAAKGELESDADYRRALSSLRSTGENKAATTIKKALTNYMRDNNKQLPTDLAQMRPYFETPLDDAILQRWEVAPASTVKSLGLGGDVIITQRAPVDDVFDTRYGIGPFGSGSTDFLSREVAPVMDPVWEAFRNKHNGEWPDDVAQLKPYVTTPEQQVALEKLMLKNAGSR